MVIVVKLAKNFKMRFSGGKSSEWNFDFFSLKLPYFLE